MQLQKAKWMVSSSLVSRGQKHLSKILMLLSVITLVISCDQPSDKAKSDTFAEEKVTAFYDSLAMPGFTISTINDSTDFSTNDLPKEGIILVKYFSPECDHCQEEARTYVAKKDSLQNIKTIWVSGDWITLKMIKDFVIEYRVEQLNPIAIGKETSNDLLGFYKLSGIPFAAIYKDNQLIKEYRGAIDFAELITINDGTFEPTPLAPKQTTTQAAE